MLKVILHHWQAQRQRPAPSVPIYDDELIVTKVNPIFDEEPAENATPAEDNNITEESHEAIRRRLYASGFDSLDSRDDPDTVITDVVAEVHRSSSRTASAEDNTSADSALPESKSENDSFTSEEKSPNSDKKLANINKESPNIIKKSPKLDAAALTKQKSPETGRSSFLHSKFQYVGRKKEPRTSILDYAQENKHLIENKVNQSELDKVTSENDLIETVKKEAVEATKEELVNETQGEKVTNKSVVIDQTPPIAKDSSTTNLKELSEESLTTSQTISEEENSANSSQMKSDPSKVDLKETLISDAFQQPTVTGIENLAKESKLSPDSSTVSQLEDPVLKAVNFSKDVLLKGSNVSTEPSAIKPSNGSNSIANTTVTASSNNSSSVNYQPSIKSAPTVSGFKHARKPSIVAKIERKNKFAAPSAGDILKSAIMGNNLVLKPSEIAKRERELRAAAKEQEAGDTEVKTVVKPAMSERINYADIVLKPVKPKHDESVDSSVPITPKTATQPSPPEELSAIPKPPPLPADQDRPPDEEISVSATPKPPKPIVAVPNESNLFKATENTEVKKVVETEEVPKANPVPATTRSENSKQSEIETKTKQSPKSKPVASKVSPKREEEVRCKKCHRVHKSSDPCPVEVPNKRITNRDYEIPRFNKKGVTRGDQTGLSPETTSSDNSSKSKSSSAGRPRADGDSGRDNKRFLSDDSNYPSNICKHCANFGRRSTRQRSPLGDLGKYDEYYLAAIHNAQHRHANRPGRHSTNDSLSDFSFDSRLDHRRHRHLHQTDLRRHALKSSHYRIPDFRANSGAELGFGNAAFENDFGVVNASPNGKGQFGIRGGGRCSSCGSCSCDPGSESGSYTFERIRPRSFAGVDDEIHAARHLRASGRWGHQHTNCTCDHTATNGRKVKFAERSNNHVKKGIPDKIKNKDDHDEATETGNVEEKTEAEDDKTTDVPEEKKNEPEAKKGKNNEKNGRILKNGHYKPLNGNGFPGQYPWEIEEWQLYMHKKHLDRKRRRALYMGIIALVIIIVIGMSVGLVMVWLRKKG